MACTLDQPRAELLAGPQTPEGRPLPRTFSEFRGFHSGETILVCGCGSSLSQVVSPERCITIGVNDVGRLFQPDYLVVLNPKEQFRADRFRFVEESRARAIFTQLNLGIRHPHVVQIRLGKLGGVCFSDPTCLPYTRNSPYVAMCLAIYMGARRIGVIGVDFTDHHFFARTGQHPLTRQFPQIDQEYQALGKYCRSHGIEVFNLSRESRLTAFPKLLPEEFASQAVSPPATPAARGRKIFFVNYKFLSCGEVFGDGLRSAANDLGLRSEISDWNDPSLFDKVKAFSPDLLFVIHGRKFAQRWGNTFGSVCSAVWLLDEPYEVDDTSQFSKSFNTVFVNDPATLHRHRNAHYLAVCYNPHKYFYNPAKPRKYSVGFVGNYSPRREEILDALARRGLLDYVVGGTWRSTAIKARNLSANIAPDQTVALYQNTAVVLNVFRSMHHFNRDSLPATSLNPRLCEALACGALVVSEGRPELAQLSPQMPVFQNAEELGVLLDQLLRNPVHSDLLRRSCARQLALHTYAQRLETVLKAVFRDSEVSTVTLPNTVSTTGPIPSGSVWPSLAAEWDLDNAVVNLAPDGSLSLRKIPDPGPGTEQGLVGRAEHENVTLSFDLFMEAGVSFLAKIHLQERKNQCSNSYHIFCDGRQTYFARHNRVLQSLVLQPFGWVKLQITYHEGLIAIRINGAIACVVRDHELARGFCFLGTKGGVVRLRNIRVAQSAPEDVRTRQPLPSHTVLHRGAEIDKPTVSILTTVYDRVHCLERCLRSVNALHYADLEQIVVADAPEPAIVEQLKVLTETRDQGRGRRTFASLQSRANDWGITPACIGLNLALGKYVCFLSDDNCYLPDHFEPLVAALEADPGTGFAYSSCLYAGLATLRWSPPQPGRIDLGQPLFRRELFDLYLNGTLPFREHAWDWRMIAHFLARGVRWKHINRPTFVFRAEKYPQLIREV